MAVEPASGVMEGNMMKRIISVILSLFISILSFAQTDVQGEFWGVRFYANKEQVFRVFSNHATPIHSNNPSELEFKNGYFGGQLWETINVKFYKDFFCRISFLSTYSDLKTASLIYEKLKNQLKQKYAELYSSAETDDGNYSYVIFGRERGCMLSFYTHSDGYDTTYAILLLYDCMALSQKQEDAQNEEL